MTGPRIFLSYARQDHKAALQLRDLIETALGAGSVWQDTRNLIERDYWWTEIEAALASVEHVVLLASAQAMA